MQTTDKATQLELARALVTALESDDSATTQDILTQLSQGHDHDLFMEVGKLTRELHMALNSFNLDPQLINLAEHEIPDTRERLNFIISTTEEAAHKTLSFIEDTSPLTSSLKETADKIEQSWQRFRNREMNAEEFRALSKEIEAYLPLVKQHSDQIHDNLSEMTMAQGYQDLTGQVIRQVITLIEDVETNLIELIRVSSQHQSSASKDAKATTDPIKAEGPQVTSSGKENAVANQDEVDDLLSSLGF